MAKKVVNEFLLANMRCPSCEDSLILSKEYEQLSCIKCNEVFPLVDGHPILLSDKNTVFLKQDLNDALLTKSTSSQIRLRKYIPSISVSLSQDKLNLFFEIISSKSNTVNILIVGSGTQKTQLDQQQSLYKNVRLVYCDIDTDSLVDLYCDAHNLPFINASFDGVICTAVLEHVMYPEIAAQEITRVVKEGGLLYNELPFMQQVHEGAYDFTRYTLSGHKRLFNSFSEIHAGMVAGPGTALVWSIENFVLAFTFNNKIRNLAKLIVRFLFFWIKYFDYYLNNKPQAMDGASCTYFLGRKNLSMVPDKEIISNYVGAKHIEHINKEAK